MAADGEKVVASPPAPSNAQESDGNEKIEQKSEEKPPPKQPVRVTAPLLSLQSSAID